MKQMRRGLKAGFTRVTSGNFPILPGVAALRRGFRGGELTSSPRLT